VTEADRSGSPDLPAFRDLPVRDGLRCSWGLWPDDRLGALNLLGPARVAAEAAEVRRGALFPLDLPWTEPDPPLFDRAAFRHEIGSVGGFGGIASFQDDHVDGWNTQGSSQWDGFRHVEREGHGWYGGLADTAHGVDHWARRGIAGRAVLADVARFRAASGRPIELDGTEPIGPDELDACMSAQGVRPQPGDVLLVRTGWAGWYRTLSPDRRRDLGSSELLRTPGLRPCDAMAELLWDYRVAAVAADNPALEPVPFVDLAAADPALASHGKGLHVRLLPMLGIPIGELFWLDDLADDCAADGRYTALLVSVPVHLPGAAASPPNAVAIK